MITFDALTLKAFIQENQEFLTGARLQKIQQPTRRDFIFGIRKNGENRKLYININPQFHHLCFMNKENEVKRRIEIPKQPPMFCMLLRKYLENSIIKKVNQPENERILEFYIETYNEIGEQIYLCLAIELMGKHSNIILYNYDTNIILGCAHNVGAEKSRERELAGTLPYSYPPKQNKFDLLQYNGGLNYETLSNDFYLISTAFGKLCNGKSLEDLRNYITLKNLNPAISKDYSYYSLYSELLENNISQKSVNDMIDNYFSHYQETDKFLTLKNHLASICRQRYKRTINSIEKMSLQIQREENSEKYRLYGDLIMANLWDKKDYSAEIEVFDYENNKNITIELDETLTLKGNANKFYKLYNKGKTSKQKLDEQKKELNCIKIWIEHIDYSLNSAQNYYDLEEIMPELIDNKETFGKSTKTKAIEPKKIELEGFTVYVGKNNRQNDYIISKLAKDEDLWFHTKDCAGSHVLLKGSNPTEGLIYKCAKLAKENSSCKNSSKIGVIYTKSKYLRKPPKSALGYVTYKNEKEIIID